MARKLRIEEEGGLYHVINRGNYRQWIFAEEGAKHAFEEALWEACERSGWVVHAFCLMSNHFHLALETPRCGLSEGMRWLQGTFANRFNRFRQQNGRLFQGRFKSLVVEDTKRLGWLCHYIHLNPVRAGICGADALSRYRWSSYWYLRQRRERPAWLRLNTALAEAGGLKDTKAGWDRYGSYLSWLSEDEPTRKRMEFDRMSRGWAVGTRSFRKELVEDEVRLREVVRLERADARTARAMAWEAGLERCLRILRKEEADLAAERKAAPWKVAVAAMLKRRMGASNRWLSEALRMGTPTSVSRYVSESRVGKRPAAEKIFNALMSKVA